MKGQDVIHQVDLPQKVKGKAVFLPFECKKVNKFFVETKKNFIFALFS